MKVAHCLTCSVAHIPAIGCRVLRPYLTYCTMIQELLFCFPCQVYHTPECKLAITSFSKALHAEVIVICANVTMCFHADFLNVFIQANIGKSCVVGDACDPLTANIFLFIRHRPTQLTLAPLGGILIRWFWILWAFSGQFLCKV